MFKIFMIPDQTWITLLIYLAAAGVMIFVLFFLPAIIELKKPKDAGPRLLIDNTYEGDVSAC